MQNHAFYKTNRLIIQNEPQKSVFARPDTQFRALSDSEIPSIVSVSIKAIPPTDVVALSDITVSSKAAPSFDVAVLSDAAVLSEAGAPSSAAALPGGEVSKFVALFLALVAFVFSIACFMPQTALAKSYSMPNVTIDAQVEENGDLLVTEKREFDFDGSFTAVWWNYNDLPEGASITINSVRAAHVNDSGDIQGEWAPLSSVPFQLAWRDAGGPGKTVYSFDEAQNAIYVFFDESDSKVTFELNYVVKDAVQAYSDVGELYWQFVGSQWEESSSNVSLTVTLPVPSNVVVKPGETIRAWGHGPLDATVNIANDGTVTYEVPHVDAGSYAEARIVFPTEWLTGIISSDNNAHFSTAHLETVLNEERTWSDRANAQRAASLGVILAVVLGCLLLLIWALRSFIRYGKELQPQVHDEYWRDVPVKGEHPAVIGRLCRFNKEDAADFTATIMHLANEGALLINKGSYQIDGTFRDKTVEDYYFTRVPEIELKLNSEIDRQAMKFLFDTVAEGQSSLWLGTITEYAKEHPQRFSDEMTRWQGTVSAHVNAGEYLESYSTVKRTRMASIGVVLIVACVIVAFLFSNPLVLIPGIVTSVVLMVVSRFMDRRTQKGADAYARCEALKKWLTEFSALNERPPLDVKVWGEFMVYALIFGVAEKAMEELAKAVPEVGVGNYSAMGLHDSTPWWIWYSAGYHTSNLPDVGTMLQSTISNSVASSISAASGNFSSGAGIGGGFSGGGGGGFGGGGGAR